MSALAPLISASPPEILTSYITHYISTTRLLSLPSPEQSIVTPDAEQNDLISCQPPTPSPLPRQLPRRHAAQMKEHAASGLHFLLLRQPVMASIPPSDVLPTRSESEKVPQFTLRRRSLSLCFYPSTRSTSIVHPSSRLSPSFLEVICLPSLI